MATRAVTQVFVVDLRSQGNQSWLGVRDFIKLKKCEVAGLVFLRT